MEELVNQSKEFKYSVDLVEKIQDKLDLIEWKDNAKEILEKFNTTDVQIEDSQESPMKSKSKNSKKSNILEDINSLIRDAQRVSLI